MATTTDIPVLSESRKPSLTETTDQDFKPEGMQLSKGADDVTKEEVAVKDDGSVHEKEAKPNTPKVEDDADYPHGLKLAVILSALCLAVFLVALDNTIISTAIPKITDQFNSITDIGWYGSAYLLTATALQPTFGRIYTIFSVTYSLLDLGLPRR
jgi:hypothetical protein